MNALLPYRSSVPGIVWPAVADGRGALLHALLYQFRQTERLPPERLRALQFRQLHRLLAHALQTVPYYAERLPQAGFDPARPLDAATWAKIPLLTRRTVQADGKRLRSAAPPKTHGPIQKASSSGSTGMPVVILKTDLWQLFWQANTVREHLWLGRDPAGRLAAIRQADAKAVYPEGLSATTWGSGTGALFDSGPAFLLGVRTDIDKQVEWLQRRRPDYLLTYPPNLEDLLGYCRSHDVRFPGLRQILTVTGPLTPELRRDAGAWFGVPVVDSYSCEEAGYMGLQCPRHDHYHVSAETVLLELLDDDGNPVPKGGVGRVVVTPLHNFAMPLIRYELGDYAEAGGVTCDCGRTLPILRRILGRRRNRVILPDGRRGWPKFAESVRFREIAGVVQFQVVQHALDDVELIAVTEAPPTTDQEAALRESVQIMLGHPFPVRFSYVEAIPRGPRGKFEPFVSKLDAG